MKRRKYRAPRVGVVWRLAWWTHRWTPEQGGHFDKPEWDPGYVRVTVHDLHTGEELAEIHPTAIESNDDGSVVFTVPRGEFVPPHCPQHEARVEAAYYDTEETRQRWEESGEPSFFKWLASQQRKERDASTD